MINSSFYLRVAEHPHMGEL